MFVSWEFERMRDTVREITLIGDLCKQIKKTKKHINLFKEIFLKKCKIEYVKQRLYPFKRFMFKQSLIKIQYH